MSERWFWLHLRLSCGLVGIVNGLPDTCSGVGTAAWTAPSYASSGYHVLCIEHTACVESSEYEGSSASCRAGDEGRGVSVSACWGGSRADCSDFHIPQLKDLVDLESAVIQQTPVQNPTRYDRLKKILEKKGVWKGLFAFFRIPGSDQMPVRVKKGAKLAGLLLAFEGGNFIWPGLEVGFHRNVTLDPVEGQDLRLELITRSLQPLIIEVSSFLDNPDCEHIIRKATPHIAKSVVSHMDHDVGKPDTNWRSSSTYFMPSDDATLRRLDQRVSALTLTRVSQQEYSQVLRYNLGERYAAHHDYFDTKLYAKNQGIQQLTHNGLFNRMATVFFYLSSVEEGGETNFPRAGGLPQPSDFEDCSRGVSITPEEGRIIIFYSQDAAGGLDEYSLHGGCSVRKGTKWSANKWIWSKKMSYLGD